MRRLAGLDLALLHRQRVPHMVSRPRISILPLNAAIDRGMDVDKFAGRLSFFFAIGIAGAACLTPPSHYHF